MASSSTSSSKINGWASMPGDIKTEMLAFSSLQAWDTVPPLTTYNAPLPDSTPANSRAPLPRHSLSLNVPPIRPTTSHYRTPSNSSSTDSRPPSRRNDPGHVPRPPNPFILFRCEFSRSHTKEIKAKDGSPLAEKTLSKRAGEAWKKLTVQQREPWKAMAERARRDHAKKFPNYKYKPRRVRSSSKNGKPGKMTRREQVKSFMERVGAYPPDSSSDGSPDSSAASPTSSSPEPDGPQRSATPTKSLRRCRSYSLPNLTKMSPDSHLRTYLLEPSLCVTNAEQKRTSVARSASAHSFAGYPIESLESPNTFIDECLLQYPLDSDSTAPSSPTSSYYDCFSFDDSYLTGSNYPSPLTTYPAIPSEEVIPNASTVIPAEGSSANAPTEPMNMLLSRRQRSSTMSALPSPLAAVSSSLANWNGYASASTISLPTFSSSSSSPDIQETETTYWASYIPPEEELAKSNQDSFAHTGSNILMIPNLGMDIDRTPRCAEFPKDVQNAYYPVPTQGPNVYPPTVDTTFANAAADLESYAIGLEDLNIVSSAYSTPMEEFDFSEYFVDSPEA
ncbi:hypothetical protein ABKN59_009326 [Abortiporus biennis]